MELKERFVSGVIKQPEDKRDFIFKASVPPAALPLKYINQNIREIENQLETGSCVANATCSSLEMMYKEKYGQKRDLNLSRMFVYYNAREPYEFLKEVDGGAYVRDGFKSINHLGVCTEDEWKFVVSEVNTKPSSDAYALALDNLVVKYERLVDINGIKSAVFQNQAVVFGIPIMSDFFDIRGPLATHNYTASGYDCGGHAMAIVGYDDTLGGFIVENSWSKYWGDNGLCLIKYDIFMQYYFDVWTATELDFERSFIEEVLKPLDEAIEDAKELTYEIWDNFKKCCRKVFRRK